MSSVGTAVTSANGKVKTPPPPKLKPDKSLNDLSAFVGRSVVLYGKGGVIEEMYGDPKKKEKVNGLNLKLNFCP